MSLSLITISCSQKDAFNSIDRDELQSLPSTDEHKEEIVKLVTEKTIEKIGSKKGKTSRIVLSETVGENNLKGDNQENEDSKKQEDSQLKSKGVVQYVHLQWEIRRDESSKSHKSKKLKNPVNVVLYFDKKDSVCVAGFNRQRRSFIESMTKKHQLNWGVLYGFHTDEAGKEYEGYVKQEITKSKYNNRRATYANLNSYYSHRTEHDPNSYSERFIHNNELEKSNNPLQGLNDYLSINQEILGLSDTSDNKKVVLYFDYDFPYYSKGDWKHLYSKYKNLNIIAISSREANFSNLNHVINSELNFKIVHECGNDGKMMESILGKI